MPKLPDYPVLIPYSELCQLLEASKQILEYKEQVAAYERQVLALRIMQQECMEKIGELQKLI